MNRDGTNGVRRMVGAPPSLPRGDAAISLAKIERSQALSHEPSVDTECSDDESEGAKTADEQPEEEATKVAFPGGEEANGVTQVKKQQQKRRKRRIRLTDQGMKAKRKAERREKLLSEKKEDEEEPTQQQSKVRSPSPSPAEKETEQIKEREKPSPETFTPFQLLCDYILRKLVAKDPDGYFTHPVTKIEAPDYHSIIEFPMDFSTIQEKIEQNFYQNFEDFKKDVHLISENAMLYNGSSSIYHLAAQKLALLSKYYLSEKHLLFLFYSLPFGKSLSLDQLGIKIAKQNERPKLKQSWKRKDERQKTLAAIKDNQKADEITKMAPAELKNRLTGRKPCHIAYLDNRDGAIALNVLTADPEDNAQLTLGSYIKPLNKGTPGVCVPFEPRICLDFLVSYTNPGPYASFAPQYDTTWATMSKRDSDLLLSCYGDKDNVSDAITIQQMVSNSGLLASDLVDTMLNDLTNDKHSETMASLENPNFEEVTSEQSDRAGNQIPKTGKMIQELASMQHQRLSKAPPPTLTDAAPPFQEETQLAVEIVQRLGQGVVELGAKPGDLISSQCLHQALGLDPEDYNVLSEFLEV